MVSKNSAIITGSPEVSSKLFQLSQTQLTVSVLVDGVKHQFDLVHVVLPNLVQQAPGETREGEPGWVWQWVWLTWRWSPRGRWVGPGWVSGLPRPFPVMFCEIFALSCTQQSHTPYISRFPSCMYRPQAFPISLQTFSPLSWSKS